MPSFHYKTAEEALKLVQSHQRVFLHGSAATPVHLINKLLEQKDRLRNVELVSITQQGVDLNSPDLEGHFFINSLFVSASNRVAVNSKVGDYVPVFLSEIPLLFTRNILPLDVAIVQVSPPDKHGYCSLGTSIDIARAAVDNAKIVIAQVNPNTPRVHGDGFVPFSKFDAAVWVEDALPEVNYSNESNDATDKIGKLVAGLVEDGATLQLGIGTIPDSVLKNLTNHKNLGIHTEMFSDGVIDLIESNVINCNYKGSLRGRVLSTFVLGSKRLYDFVDNNPFIELRESSTVNDTARIRKNPKMIAINSAIEVDLTGQVCADSIGPRMYSGVGGQMDFIRGASLSDGGKAIIALPSTTKNGVSRIVPFLKHGAGVVTTRGHIQYVITENGIADLYGKTLKQRAVEMVKIAHSDHQESIEREYFYLLDKM